MRFFRTINKTGISIIAVVAIGLAGFGIYKVIDILLHPPLYVIIQFEDLIQMENASLDEYEFFTADLKSSKWTKYFLNDLELEVTI